MSCLPSWLHLGGKLEARLPSEVVVSCLWKANHYGEQVKTVMIHVTAAPGCTLDIPHPTGLGTSCHGSPRPGPLVLICVHPYTCLY